MNNKNTSKMVTPVQHQNQAQLPVFIKNHKIPERIITPRIIDKIQPFNKSKIKVFIVVRLKPYFSSIKKVSYIENGKLII